MSARIMIVDDEPGIVDVVQRYFALSGYEVIAAQSGEEALKKISCRPDLILLDINMPGLNGLEVCARIRAHVSCPILFLTARIERSDKIVGFQAGGDDYIVKPFDMEVLGARVEAHLRREQRRTTSVTVRCFGELAVDYTGRTVSIRGEAVKLSKREFDIVELLSMHQGQVFDRERIYEIVWGIDGMAEKPQFAKGLSFVYGELFSCGIFTDLGNHEGLREPPGIPCPLWCGDCL